MAWRTSCSAKRSRRCSGGCEVGPTDSRLEMSAEELHLLRDLVLVVDFEFVNMCQRSPEIPSLHPTGCPNRDHSPPDHLPLIDFRAGYESKFPSDPGSAAILDLTNQASSFSRSRLISLLMLNRRHHLVQTKSSENLR